MELVSKLFDTPLYTVLRTEVVVMDKTVGRNKENMDSRKVN